MLIRGSDPDTLYVKYKRQVQIIHHLYFQMVKQLQVQIVIVFLYHAVVEQLLQVLLHGEAGTYYINGFFVQVRSKL